MSGCIYEWLTGTKQTHDVTFSVEVVVIYLRAASKGWCGPWGAHKCKILKSPWRVESRPSDIGGSLKGYQLHIVYLAWQIFHQYQGLSVTCTVHDVVAFRKYWLLLGSLLQLLPKAILRIGLCHMTSKNLDHFWTTKMLQFDSLQIGRWVCQGCQSHGVSLSKENPKKHMIALGPMARCQGENSWKVAITICMV